MVTEFAAIVQFILAQFAATWPYLLITIPLAVAVNLSGASRYITRALRAQPLPAIVLATAVGAFSPFCSCSVIPVVASLLIGGVPLAPAMAFWIASPSMDPEIFFLSVSTLGWELSVWRLGATLALSLAAGLITHGLMRHGLLGDSVLRKPGSRPFAGRVAAGWHGLRLWAGLLPVVAPRPILAAATVEASAVVLMANCGSAAPASRCGSDAAGDGGSGSCAAQEADAAGCAAAAPEGAASSFRRRLLTETFSATAMVVKFMLLAYLLEALIVRYVPQTWIVAALGGDQPQVIALAALFGVPMYTSNLTAMPLIGGLLAQGMAPAAALAFLIAGPTTTLPAMAAVAGLVTRRVFLLYVGYALFGAMAAGYAYALVQRLP
jgi:uncharacterized membrane protein YraQ (UPF0718 family)